MSLFKKNTLIRNNKQNNTQNNTPIQNNIQNNTSIQNNAQNKINIMVNGNKSKWHIDWQNKFDLREVIVGNRRADVLVNNTVIEFQRSHISKKEVDERNNDYSNYNKNVIWVIDCNNANNDISFEVTETLPDIFFLIFKKNDWKYKSFVSNTYIYLDYDNMIYRINPKQVKHRMIDVRGRFPFDKFINSIKIDENIWNDDILPQYTLYYNQRGAGCGKTYESIQLIENNLFKHKKLLYI